MVQAFSTLAVIGMLFSPSLVEASVFSFGIKEAQAQSSPIVLENGSSSVQTVALVSNIGPGGNMKKEEVITEMLDSSADEKVMTASIGPRGTALDVVNAPEAGSISIYTVRGGDTVGKVAEMFDVTKATILAANDLKSGQALKAGMVLTILPTSGHIHTVKKGDTLKTIARKYQVDSSDIALYNELGNDSDITIGAELVIPDLDFDSLPQAVVKKPSTSSSGPKNSSGSAVYAIHDATKIDLGNLILRPVALGASIRTQGAHGFGGTAVDLGANAGTEIYAATSGTVMVARSGGWNGGYGSYVIISTQVNGHTVQTVYAHMSKVMAVQGSTVSRGQLIGLVGRTGKATGNHLHFEVRGALNPLTVNKNYTGQ